LKVRSVGDGCSFSAIVPDIGDGEMIVSWNGRNHFDVNVWAKDESAAERIRSLVQTAIERSITTSEQETFQLSQVQYDKQPRGFGRVVSFVEDMEEDVWFGNVRHEEVHVDEETE
jgi:hypothetical protein